MNVSQKNLPSINSAHGSETRNIINELIKLFNDMGYTYNESLQKAHDILDEAQQTNDMNENVQQQIDTLIIESGTSDAEVIQARGGLPLLKDRLDKNDEQLEQTVNKTEGFESVLKYGAKRDGSISASQAIDEALLENDVVKLPDGVFLIESTIKLGKNKKLIGNGKDTVIKVTGNFNVFEFDVDSSIEKMVINTRESTTFNNSIFEISDNTLKSDSFNGSANTRIIINDIDIYTEYGGNISSIFTLKMSNAFDNITGFYGVKVSNINHIGYGNNYFNFFMRNYCKNNTWITGVEFTNIINHGTYWGFFDGEHENNLQSSDITSNVDKLSVINYQHQSRNIQKAFAYIRSGEKMFVNSIPWDWVNGTGVYKNRPVLIDRSLRPSQKLSFVGRELSIIHINIIENNEIKELDYNNHYIFNELVKGTTTEMIPKIIGMGSISAINENNNITSYLLYRGGRLLNDNRYLIFQYRNINLFTWSDITIYRKNGVYYYNTSKDLTTRYGFRYRINNGEIEIYMTMEDANYKFSQYDIIKTDVLANNPNSWGVFNQYNNHYVTINNFSGEHLENIPNDLIIINKES